ncbi:MAG: bifunctional demethylmenaquinone methyltransferase/2-methoxy-6-polyprenyl-1,4-benzoquinol methylase UbiE [Chlamydiae bacterium]|nr:bifunctional demethylmenaquinone methyltransferase/2-methoxy-6-polyprenyl-1,4-benzoquinol methylase UbiE [Chlamydiota bacterium]
MFNQIARTYDPINRVLSFGLDLSWRKKLAKYLPPREKLHLLDLATGTADQLIALFESSASIHSAIGIDLASEMLCVGEKKLQKKTYKNQIELQVGDAMQLPFEENSFEACTFSFGIRNIADPFLGLEQIWRILKPGGRCLILEFSLPPHPFRWPYLWYLRHFLPWIGGILSRELKAYRYLNQTIETFPSGSQFLTLMEKASFHHLKAHPMALGAVTLYVGEK